MTTPASGLTAAQIVAAFEKPLQPVRMSPFYRLGLALVALMMVLLPLVYLGLIGLVGYFLYYHATVNIFEGVGKATATDWLLFYFAPLLAGGILILFMIKPLFARRVASSKPVSVTGRDEPVLFELVRKLCEVVGAPMPRRIDVDCQVNASASFRRGMMSFFGHDLLLTIGLPLVAGMRLRNLVGILAHEFGHFAQGTGMRLTYLIRAINIWFARVVYERDAWDARIEQWSKEIDIHIGIILYLARFFIWLTRRVLWALMMLGHALSMFALRQMEYDADQYEIQVSGSKTFKESTRGMAELNLAFQAAISSLQESWNQRRLGDDLPALIAAQRETIPADVREKFVGEWLGRKGSLLDTHPPDTRRVEAALRANAPGVFTLDVPAAALFRQFDALARKATYAHYREVLGDEVSEKNLVPMSEFLRQQGRDQDE